MLEITKENFAKEVVQSAKPVLIDFWAPWCMPCKMIAPAIEELAVELSAEIKVAKANVDDSPELATELSILNIPTLVLFKGGKEVTRMIGVNQKAAIAAKVRSFIS